MTRQQQLLDAITATCTTPAELTAAEFAEHLMETVREIIPEATQNEVIKSFASQAGIDAHFEGEVLDCLHAMTENTDSRNQNGPANEYVPF